jgi:hypothetical protein
MKMFPLPSLARATAALACSFVCALGAACGDGDSDNNPDAGPDVDAPPPCVMNPQTHAEIINACTTGNVDKIDKKPVLPLVQSDGTLPPIP